MTIEKDYEIVRGSSGNPSAFINSTTSFPLRDEEKQLSDEAIKTLMKSFVEDGYTRCTGCKELVRIDETRRVAFADRYCLNCCEKKDTSMPPTH